MSTTISTLLDDSKITVEEVASGSGVDTAALNDAIEVPVETWSIKILNAFAKGLGMRASDLLNKLQPSDYELKLDDQRQVIQGVQIDNQDLYEQVKFAVISNHLEGWQPTREDIQSLLANLQESDSEFEKMYEELK